LSDNEVKDYQEKKAIVNAPLRWTDLRLSEQVKTIRFFRDKDNNIVTMPVVLLDPTQTGLNILPMGRVGISDPGAVNSYARVFGLPCCGWPETTLGLVTHSTQMVQKGANLEAVRTPTIFRSQSVNLAAAATIWTPAAGTRFRLLGGIITGTGAALAAAAYTLIQLTDEAAATNIDFGAWIPAAGAEMNPIAFDLRPNGYLSTAVNNRLRVTLLANFASGSLRVTVWGNEEV
jgi:hypothetical protein